MVDMKKVLLSLMLIACSALVSAVSLAQNSFSYQSVIRNNGEVVSIDGVLGPQTAKAIQRTLNDGKW